jgi:hypothetical protein
MCQRAQHVVRLEARGADARHAQRGQQQAQVGQVGGKVLGRRAAP